ncbi:unnamed protein product [Brugia pahangi]|uniref:Ovule protein n=1 Tax=Brugia pahangi TaxID=6280 RepID=A0A0N4T9I6_BRUPA|nr:unnamed protein product [Brugia pahangi]
MMLSCHSQQLLSLLPDCYCYCYCYCYYCLPNRYPRRGQGYDGPVIVVFFLSVRLQLFIGEFVLTK